jgi:deferrochelatase/peroxidase EfeB
MVEAGEDQREAVGGGYLVKKLFLTNMKAFHKMVA